MGVTEQLVGGKLEPVAIVEVVNVDVVEEVAVAVAVEEEADV